MDDTLETVYQNYIDALRSSDFSGDIRTDYATRLTAATDNSIYQIIPQAIFFPRNTHDISTILKLADQPPFFSVKLTARGGGTGTNGQSLSTGIIIDCSKYMRDILEINFQENWVRVQPGITPDQLNEYLKSSNLYFAPEISPGNRATIGGMINTDACGNGSKTIGRTSDHVLGLTCVMSDGKILNTQQHTEKNLEQQLTNLLIQHQNLIREKFFTAPRTLSGYNLAKAWSGHLDLNYLLCGSEGTLGIISECKLKLSTQPSFKKLLLIRYKDFNDALRAKEITPNINPLVIETIDENLISIARQDSIYFYIKDFIQDANAINLVEFVGNDSDEINKKISRLCENIDNSSTACGFYLAKNEAEIKLLWELRKKSVGLISKRQDGTRRPIPFIEDTAVPPEKLADYIAELKQLLDKHQLVYGMYGHIDAGCIHVRPALDTRLSFDEKLIRILSDEVVILVKKYGGVIWGEHGKGFRSEYGPEFFGDTLYHVIRQIKTLFDPHNRLNPGKIATPLNSDDTIVTLDGPMRGHFDKQISDVANVKYASAIACNGNGACFNFSTKDVMCPSWKVTQDRVQSPKGRAVILREWLRKLSIKNDNVNYSGSFTFIQKILNHFAGRKDFSHEVYSALSGCLSCKACANQCPLSVNIPDLKATFLSHYHQYYMRKFRDYLIANMEYIAFWQSKFSRISNFLLDNRIAKRVIKKLFRLVDLPRINSATTDLFHMLPDSVSMLPENAIILLQDAFTSFYEKNVLIKSSQFFTSLGFSVYVAPFFANGKPLHVQGFLDRFSRTVKNNIEYLRKLAVFNVPLIGLDPSVTLTYRDEYQKCIAPEKIGFEILLPQEFLQTHLKKIPKIKENKNFYLLSHCTEKTAHIETEKEWQAIFSAAGLTLIPLAAGCCGMAGSYGHETEHVKYSHELFNMDWQRHIAEKSVLATGYSCRSQAKRFSHVQLLHPLEALLHEINKELL